ncbi:hypothetical protein ARMGADRAFT_135747 [Armillaria gallica]|uniref:Uncharacterized protein n=1 Tax=Armillaria gallica TaxID=47427 RepID=A0A2H3CDM4_ARMGA|nr:hypothetical protein ARMGADRAFT_135747 [Armillaria gallica]
MPSHTFFGRNIGSKGGVVSYLHLEMIIPEAAAPPIAALYRCGLLHGARVVPITKSCTKYQYSNCPTLKFELEGRQIYESAPLPDPSSVETSVL